MKKKSKSCRKFHCNTVLELILGSKLKETIELVDYCVGEEKSNDGLWKVNLDIVTHYIKWLHNDLSHLNERLYAEKRYDGLDWKTILSDKKFIPRKHYIIRKINNVRYMDILKFLTLRSEG